MVPGFSRLAVKGYRRLSDVDLELRPLNVLRAPACLRLY